MNELIEIAPASALVAFAEPNGLDPFIDAVRKIVDEFEHDLSTATSRKKTASLAAKVSSFKVSMDEMGKSLTEDWKNKSKVVDQARKKMRDELDELRDEARRPLTEWEDKEEMRVAKIREKITMINEYQDNHNLETCRRFLDVIEFLKIDEAEYQEFQAEAVIAQKSAREFLVCRINELEKQESERKELERLRAEAEARTKADMEESLRKEGELRAQREADAKIKAEQARAESEKRKAIEDAERKELEARRLAESNAKAMRDAEERARMAEETAKKNAIAGQKKLADDEAKRKADMEHARNLKTQSKLALIEQGLQEKEAVKVILAICEGKIPHITMRF